MIKSRQIAKALYDLNEEERFTPPSPGGASLAEKFLDFMKNTKLSAQIPAVLYHLEKIEKEAKEKKGVSIESAHELKGDTVKEIKNYLKAGEVDQTLKINKNLVAGFTAKWQGKFYDMSFATGLKKLEENIIK